MTAVARFAYAQARLQARHGQRANQQLWQRLRSSGHIADYLQLARQTVLRSWVQGLHPSQSSHEIELSLRSQFRQYIGDVASWLPGRWRSVAWQLGRLPDLPALQHLLSGAAAPAWMQDDPALRAFVSESIQLRLDALQRSDCDYLVRGWQAGEVLHDAWYDNWRKHWPGPARLNAGMEDLARMFRRQLQARVEQPDVPSARLRAALEARLNVAFRKYSFQPAAACAHLGLIALDLERLRGDLLRRLMFDAGAGSS